MACRLAHARREHWKASAGDRQFVIAFVFPGQGSQVAGMGRALSECDSTARQAFGEMDEALGFSISRLCFQGSSHDLELTENTQPAVLAHSVAAWRCLEAHGIAPDVVAGHSLGEYSALVAAGVLAAADAVRTVRRRWQYMQEATPVGQGAMRPLVGLDAGQSRALPIGRRGARS
jgi:[acyl-carrier-protein] S-malonyltransferase